MNNEVNELKLEIEVLKKRIEVLEGIENRRKVMKLIKAIIYVLLISAVLFAVYKFYQKINNYYNDINNLVTDPFSAFTNLTKKDK